MWSFLMKPQGGGRGCSLKKGNFSVTYSFNFKREDNICFQVNQLITDFKMTDLILKNFAKFRLTAKCLSRFWFLIYNEVNSKIYIFSSKIRKESFSKWRCTTISWCTSSLENDWKSFLCIFCHSLLYVFKLEFDLIIFKYWTYHHFVLGNTNSSPLISTELTRLDVNWTNACIYQCKTRKLLVFDLLTYYL